MAPAASPAVSGLGPHFLSKWVKGSHGNHDLRAALFAMTLKVFISEF
jgi:hypothetical protein